MVMYEDDQVLHLLASYVALDSHSSLPPVASLNLMPGH